MVLVQVTPLRALVALVACALVVRMAIESARGDALCDQEQQLLRAPSSRGPAKKPASWSGDDGDGEPAAVVVLGMHHTGTSMLTLMLMQFGLDPGGIENLMMEKGNPVKFFELEKSVVINEPFVHRNFGYGYEWGKAKRATQEAYLDGVKEIVEWLDNKVGPEKSWLLKDPRLCLVAEQWISQIPAPRKRVCVLSARDPLVSAARFVGTRFGGKGKTKAIELWEEFYVRSIQGCRRAGASIVIASHEQLNNEPWEAAKDVYAKLREAGVGAISLPSEQEYQDKFLSLWYNPNKVSSDSEAKEKFLNTMTDAISPRAVRIWEAFASDNLDQITDVELMPTSWTTDNHWTSA